MSALPQSEHSDSIPTESRKRKFEENTGEDELLLDAKTTVDELDGLNNGENITNNIPAKKKQRMWEQQKHWQDMVKNGTHQKIVRLKEMKPSKFATTLRGIYGYYSPTMGGKTQLLEDILFEQYDQFDDIYVWAKNQYDFRYIQPDSDKRFVNFGRGRRCSALMQRLLLQKSNDELPDNYEVCFIFDDQIDNKDFHGNEVLDLIASYGRQLHITTHITTQRPTRIGPMLRCNTRIALLYQPDTEIMKMYFNDFSGTMRNAELYRNTIDFYTRDYRVVIFHRNDKSGLWQQQFHHYLARSIPPEEWMEKLIGAYGYDALADYYEREEAKRKARPEVSQQVL
ncbi:MAG: hypothetical protein GY845_35405 [Planctomycetes bacterium]|nr:hypothetical protein [Planctomycetota bacterium]